MPLQHDHILNPITALEFYQKPNGPLLVLAGEGSFLKVFDTESSKLLSQSNILGGQAIHGIKTTDYIHEDDVQALIWGGPSLAMLKKHEFENLLAQDAVFVFREPFEAPDWILDAAISPTDSECCYLITAHNTVVRARLEKTSSRVIFETEASPSRSILYSAHLVIEPSGSILIAAGTVFGEIIVWSCTTSEDVHVLFTFTGHEGSIFGVNISPLLSFQDKRQSRLLASCSDDRTIRVWDLTTNSETKVSDSKMGLVRETGFSPNGDGQARAKSRCVATVMAHTSRIWRVRFLMNQANLGRSDLSLLSFGEDSTTQQWNLDINASAAPRSDSTLTEAVTRLTHTNTFAFHSGKHIWSTGLHYKNSSLAILATGGADGKISLRDIELDSSFIYSSDNELGFSYTSSTLSDDIVWDTSWDLEQDILQQLRPLQTSDDNGHEGVRSESADIEMAQSDLIEGKAPKKKKAKKIVKDVFNKYAFVSEDQLLLTTTFGRILLAQIGSNTQWKEVVLPQSISQDLKSYSVVQGVPEFSLAFLAGASGKIYVFDGGLNVFEVGSVEGKVADMFKIFNPETGNFELLVTTLGADTSVLFHIQVSSTVSLLPFTKYKLPEKFVVTSAGRIDDLVVLGSRNGSLAIFDHKDDVFIPQTSSILSMPLGDAITTIIPLAELGTKVHKTSYFLTTRRDGMYSIFAATTSPNSDTDNTKGTISCVHVGGLPFGPMVESVWYDQGNLFLYGFKSTKFVVWNETQQLEVINVDCGGAHRNYAYSPLRNSSGGHFAYTKASRLHIHSQRKPSHTIVKCGGHGREIKACTVSPNGEFFVTGAEDTTIRIWSYNDKKSPLKNQFRQHAIMQKHSAGIQHLHWHGSSYLFSSGGNEEFFIWSIERIPGYGLGVVCEATCPDQSEEQDLRIMSFDVTDVSQSKMLISLAYSDSTMRIYMYSKENEFLLVANGRYTSACLTQIRHLRVSNKGAYILTAATDGNITLWKVDLTPQETVTKSPDLQLSFFGTEKIHQSTIKSLDYIISDKTIIVVTGGDDNALGISIYSMENSTQLSVSPQPKHYILRSAHAAAITGLCILPVSDSSSTTKTIKFVSSGNDQRVKEWQVQLSIDAVEGSSVVGIQNLSDEFTSIADVGDVAFLRSQSKDSGESAVHKALIVGNGMEIWRLPS